MFLVNVRIHAIILSVIMLLHSDKALKVSAGLRTIEMMSRKEGHGETQLLSLKILHILDRYVLMLMRRSICPHIRRWHNRKYHSSGHDGVVMGVFGR